MSATDSEMEAAAEDSLVESLGNDVTSYKVGNREVKRERNPKDALAALLMLRGLQSGKRGNNLGKIDRPA